jgi:hypothetical protein
MAINLGNVNIPPNEFQRLSQGECNAGGQNSRGDAETRRAWRGGALRAQ